MSCWRWCSRRASVAGGVAYLKLRVPDAGDAFALVTADLLDPPAERAVFRARAVALVLIYAVGVASDAVAGRARQDQRRVGDRRWSAA